MDYVLVRPRGTGKGGSEKLDGHEMHYFDSQLTEGKRAVVQKAVRHEVAETDVPARVEAWESHIPELLAYVEAKPKALSLLIDPVMSAACTRSLIDPSAARLESWEAWVVAMQVSSAVFASATAEPGGTAQCRIADREWSIPAIGPQYYTNAGRWLSAFWLCVVCREAERLSMLSSVSVELLRQSGAEFDEYVYPWVQALQAFWNGDAELTDRLAEAVQGSDPANAPVAGEELMLRVLYPPLQAFSYVLQRDQEKFDEALLQGLVLYRQYWSADEERLEDSDGLVALALLGVACLAKDVGMSVGVESDYLPKHLLERSWIGEFPT
ncbi:immunity 49 family protein [Kitasatospora sp. NPDC096147]|uniref:immunity 49 family protein n=1 Tax=Kitasatospora sp. NPDC096147 TaxID=3364093 RepID=UPI0038180029